jgi:carboxynorspermidine decarboxylase
MRDIDPSAIEKTPAFVVSTGALEKNLELLSRVQREAGCKILLALKGFSLFAAAEQIRRHLPGVAASGAYEARLGREEFGGEVHTYCAAFGEADFVETLELSDHVIFNSLSQWERLRPAYERFRRETGKAVELGLRMNPGYSEVEVPLYDPCAPGSRLGIPRAAFEGASLEGISGLHFHSLCEQGADVLERTLERVEADFGELLSGMRWVNFGGGHHITREGYDVERLIRLVRGFRERYGVEVYLEPGEAIALGTGVLVASVLDVPKTTLPTAILDTSVTCHMPDCLEMPYRPEIVGAGLPDEKPHTYRLGGLSCLAGDVAGDYSFDAPLEVGQRLVFLDMAHYTMVKTTMFNGVPLPDIVLWDSQKREPKVVRRFGYEDYRGRLS